METNIKRLAQFLFDNAETITTELKKSSSYRSVSIALDMFKHENPELRLSLSLYDEKTTHYYLRDDEICIERFKALCTHLNYETRNIATPKPVKVRKNL